MPHRRSTYEFTTSMTSGGVMQSSVVFFGLNFSTKPS